MSPLVDPPDLTVREAPEDVKRDMPDPSVKLCNACVNAYRNGIEPGGTACEVRHKLRTRPGPAVFEDRW